MALFQLIPGAERWRPCNWIRESGLGRQASESTSRPVFGELKCSLRYVFLCTAWFFQRNNQKRKQRCAYICSDWRSSRENWSPRQKLGSKDSWLWGQIETCVRFFSFLVKAQKHLRCWWHLGMMYVTSKKSMESSGSPLGDIRKACFPIHSGFSSKTEKSAVKILDVQGWIGYDWFRHVNFPS